LLALNQGRADEVAASRRKHRDRSAGDFPRNESARAAFIPVETKIGGPDRIFCRIAAAAKEGK